MKSEVLTSGSSLMWFLKVTNTFGYLQDYQDMRNKGGHFIRGAVGEAMGN